MFSALSGSSLTNVNQNQTSIESRVYIALSQVDQSRLVTLSNLDYLPTPLAYCHPLYVWKPLGKIVLGIL